MSKIRAWLKGKKTYLIAVGAILGAVTAYGSGEMELMQAIEAVIAAVLAVTIRAGVTNG